MPDTSTSFLWPLCRFPNFEALLLRFRPSLLLFCSCSTCFGVVFPASVFLHHCIAGGARLATQHEERMYDAPNTSWHLRWIHFKDILANSGRAI